MIPPGNAIFAAAGASVFETMSQLAHEHGAINLGQGFPEALEPPEVIEAAARALRDGPHQYPSAWGVPALRQAVAEANERFWGLATDPTREVLVTSGATEALAACFLGLLNAGDEVIVLQPAFDCYQAQIRRAGAVAVGVALSAPDWTLPRAALAAAITPRTRAIVLNTPMNPCGKVFDGPELDFIAELLIAHDLVAICDEVYEHLTFEDRAPLPLMTRPGVRARCLRIGSAGKTFSVTGWKIGYVSGDAALLAPVARAHQVTTFSTPPFLQTAVAHGLRLADGYFDGLRATLRTRRDLLSRGLTEAGFEVLGCQGTYFLLAGTDGAEDDVGFCRRLVEEAGVTAIPLSGFFTPAGRRPLVRFCFAKRLETLEGGIARLVAWRGGQRWRRAS